jgi:hypothetical protein
MKTKIIYFLLLMAVIAMLGIQSCGKGSPCEGRDMTDAITVYTIADSIKANIPYTGWDTLVFVSDAGDTATLYGQGKRTYFKESFNSTSGDCPKQTIRRYENNDFIFWGGKGLSNLSFVVYRNHLDINPSYNSIKISSNDIVLDITSYGYLDSPQRIFDSIILNGIYHKGVYTDDIKKNILYSFSQGVLLFDDNQNVRWTKIK